MFEKQDTIDHSQLAIERAIDELRRQMGLIVHQGDTLLAVCPLEFVHDTDWAAIKLLPKLRLLITGARAKSIGLKTDTAAVRIDATGLSLADIEALAIMPPGKLPSVKSVAGDESDELLLALAKYASLLPALLLIEGSAYDMVSTWQRLDLRDLRRYVESPPIEIVESITAALPIENAEDARVISFRLRHSSAVHMALIVGKPKEDALTRIHSSCVTGDLLGSLRCDCGDQLRMALERLTAEKSGVLIYLHQEGRGIGIANKLRAYGLQEQGSDTYDANLMLGFDEDERDFAIAAAILKKLGLSRIRLLTNNPQKIAALEKSGISISERIPLVAPSGRHNHAYLSAKAKKSGHLF